MAQVEKEQLQSDAVVELSSGMCGEEPSAVGSVQSMLEEITRLRAENANMFLLKEENTMLRQQVQQCVV